MHYNRETILAEQATLDVHRVSHRKHRAHKRRHPHRHVHTRASLTMTLASPGRPYLWRRFCG